MAFTGLANAHGLLPIAGTAVIRPSFGYYYIPLFAKPP